MILPSPTRRHNQKTHAESSVWVSERNIKRKNTICRITLVSIKAKTKFQPTESQRVIGSDAFSYYSNKFNLEKARQFKQDDVQVIQTSGMSSQGQGPVKRRKGSKAKPVQVQDGRWGIRQTRISFEAHPSLIIDDEIICMLEQMDCADISDDEDDEDPNEEASDGAASTSRNEEKRSGEEQQQPVATMVSHCQMIKSQPTSQKTLSFPFHGKQTFGEGPS